LNLEIAPNIDKVVADPLKLRQSLINLLSNAAKFTARGTISVTVGRRESPNGEMLKIEVRDTGIGISPEGLQRLFQDFSQAERNTASRFGGTGLGLALTRRFCESMGGTVRVESSLGIGSSFTIEIPTRPRRFVETSSPTIDSEPPARLAANC
jgi:signal transduction histidine kinase